ncbi:MAG TPA: CcoQ/FixQ family Cbb3-type cytochrome c oxidase assembly chaperone [Bacteroidia bacterium]|nr:CcoQ/FixQ family Cbb3-type cytochrome c oxidase assembly chaperone [Bacteroidia bacterium]
MKFRNYLESITGIEIYPLISLLLFTIFFALLCLYLWKKDKTWVTKMKNIPLEQ